MTRIIRLTLLTLVGCACGDVQRPTLCVFSANDGLDPNAVQANACPAPERAFADGETIYVLHTLPNKAQVDAPVSVSIESPCQGSGITSQHYYDNNRVLFSAVAPPGAACSLVVTARVLNETTRFISRPASAECMAKCPDAVTPVDAGSTESTP